jgi:DNA-binding response OmpR family regulator
MQARQETEQRSGLEILLVDRDHDTLEMYSALLNHWGYQPRCASTGEEASLLAGAVTPDIVITSMILPDITGFELGVRLRKNPSTRTALLVLLTGWKRDDMDADVEALFDHILGKPVPVETLCVLIETHALALGRTLAVIPH